MLKSHIKHNGVLEFRVLKMATPDAAPDVSQQSQGLTQFDAKREAKLRATRGIKRRNTLIGKADDLHMECGYKVLLALQKGHHSYVYTSVDTPDVIADLVSRFPHQPVTS